MLPVSPEAQHVESNYNVVTARAKGLAVAGTSCSIYPVACEGEKLRGVAQGDRLHFHSRAQVPRFLSLSAGDQSNSATKREVGPKPIDHRRHAIADSD